jgi:hypothetical protein
VYFEAMMDSGAQLFMGDAMYYRQVDEVTISVCVAKKISDEAWSAYLDGAYATAQKLRRPPVTGIIYCLEAFPNARQRQLSNDFIAKYYERRFRRVAIITDSAVIRSAMTAMRWVIPSLTMRAFLPAHIAAGITWLREVATFDVPGALGAWSDAMTQLSIRPRLREKGA